VLNVKSAFCEPAWNTIPNPFHDCADAIDEFIRAAEDARLAVVAIAVILGWPSTRRLTVPEIAEQLGCTPAALTRSIARFKTMANLAGGLPIPIK
jgi:hypothetical protein